MGYFTKNKSERSSISIVERNGRRKSGVSKISCYQHATPGERSLSADSEYRHQVIHWLQPDDIPMY